MSTIGISSNEVGPKGTQKPKKASVGSSVLVNLLFVESVLPVLSESWQFACGDCQHFCPCKAFIFPRISSLYRSIIYLFVKKNEVFEKFCLILSHRIVLFSKFKIACCLFVFLVSCCDA